MFKVIYTVKDKSGFLVDKTKKFDLMQDAFKFIRELQGSMIGKPTIERI
jgi:hypothetical protein